VEEAAKCPTRNQQSAGKEYLKLGKSLRQNQALVSISNLNLIVSLSSKQSSEDTGSARMIKARQNCFALLCFASQEDKRDKAEVHDFIIKRRINKGFKKVGRSG
jgi:hypothetical protein